MVCVVGQPTIGMPHRDRVNQPAGLAQHRDLAKPSPAGAIPRDMEQHLNRRGELTVQRGPDRGTSAEALDALTIDLRPDDIAQRAPATVRVLTKAAALADQSDEPVTITVRGLPAQREWIVVQLRGASRPHTNTVIVEQPASMPSVQLSPVPSPVSDDHNEGR